MTTITVPQSKQSTIRLVPLVVLALVVTIIVTIGYDGAVSHDDATSITPALTNGEAAIATGNPSAKPGGGTAASPPRNSGGGTAIGETTTGVCGGVAPVPRNQSAIGTPMVPVVFIHIPKCAGTSVEKGLEAVANRRLWSVCQRMPPNDWTPVPGHSCTDVLNLISLYCDEPTSKTFTTIPSNADWFSCSAAAAMGHQPWTKPNPPVVYSGHLKYGTPTGIMEQTTPVTATVLREPISRLISCELGRGVGEGS